MSECYTSSSGGTCGVTPPPPPLSGAPPSWRRPSRLSHARHGQLARPAVSEEPEGLLANRRRPEGQPQTAAGATTRPGAGLYYQAGCQVRGWERGDF